MDYDWEVPKKTTYIIKTGDGYIIRESWDTTPYPKICDTRKCGKIPLRLRLKYKVVEDRELRSRRWKYIPVFSSVIPLGFGILKVSG